MSLSENYYKSAYSGLEDCYVVLSTFSPNTNRAVRVKHLEEEVSSRSNESVCLFHTYAVFQSPPQNGRGKSADISAINGAFLDIDIGESGRYVANGKNPAASLETIKNDLISWGLPEPSAIVSSGNGIHVEYRLDKPFFIESDADRETALAMLKGFNGYAIEKANAHGIKLDSMGDLARVKRAAGSKNWKDAGNPKPVEVLELHDKRTYTFEQLAAFKSSSKERPSARKAALNSATAQTTAPQWDLIAKHCPFARHCLENAAHLSEPVWFALLGIIARCEGGRSIAHDISRLDHRYSQAETDDKIDSALKADSCVSYAYIREQLGFTDIEDDILASRMHSPLQFGFSTDALISIQRNHAYDLSTERFYDLATLDRYSDKGFGMAHGHLLANPVAAFRASPISIKASKIDYLPGQSRLVTHGNNLVLNVYRNSGLKPAEGDCSTILAHFDYLIPDQNEREHVLNYLACMVQAPGQKIASALLFIGSQGTGKSTIARWITDILGDTNVKELSVEAISSPFQADRTNIQCLVLNEVHGIDRSGANSLKSWITEENMQVHDKGIQRFNARTPRAILLISNHIDAISLEEGDRRCAVIKTTHERADTAYFERLNQKAKSELPAFAAWLHNRNLEHFDPYAPAPESELKGIMVRCSQTPLEAAIQEAFEAEAGCFSRDFGTAQEVISTVTARGFEFRRPTAASVGAILSKMHFAQLPQQRVGKEKLRFWVWRDTKRWSLEEPSKVAAHYTATQCCTLEIGSVRIAA